MTTRLLCILALWPLCLVPAGALARSPLTDSTDVKINTGTSEVENSIAISPLDPKVLFVSNIKDGPAVTSWLSRDAGKSWRTLGLSAAGIDPIAAIGVVNGTEQFYVNHVADSVLVDFTSDTDSTASWAQATVETLAVNPHGFPLPWDKNFLWVQNDTLYCGFSDAEGSQGGVGVYLKYSTDNGESWSDSPIPIYDGNKAGRNYIAVNIATGTGRVYAAWSSRDATEDQPAHGILFRYSENHGQTWQSPDSGQVIKSLGGFDRHSLGGKTMRATVSPSMAVDGDGYIYVVYADKEPEDDNTNVYVLKSTNHGQTWDALGGENGDPVYKQINTDTAGTNKDQWFPWISWDPCTDALVVVFYDSRDDTSRVNTYVAVSYNGGEDWRDFKVSDHSWNGDPPGSGDVWAGDYISVAAKDGMAFPVWSDSRADSLQYRAYVSPLYLWGVDQDSVSASEPGRNDTLVVTASWATNIAAEAGDYLKLTPPDNGTPVTSSGCTTCSSNGGKHHTRALRTPWQPGDWTYEVTSTRSGCSARGSDPKTLHVWGVYQDSVSADFETGTNDSIEVTASWVTSDSAGSGDQIILYPPGGGTPITSPACTTCGTIDHTRSLTARCQQPGDWSYRVRSTKGSSVRGSDPISFYLWGVYQNSVQGSVVGEVFDSLTVSASWTTSDSASTGDYLVLRCVPEPYGTPYTLTSPTCTGCAGEDGKTHATSFTVPCDPGYWYYTVKSTKPGSSARGSNEKFLRKVTYCAE